MEKLVFINHLKKYLSENEITSLMNAIEDTANTISALVIDEDKISNETILSIYPTLKKHPIAKNTYLFNKKELDLGKSILFEIGAFYIFEPCSALVSHFLNPNEKDLILDIAAAPGGKSIHTSFLMNNKGQIISNEISKSRAEILSSNVEKYGRKNISVISSDVASLEKVFPNTFSKIILDAPCSGSGMFRKEEKMMNDWTLEKMISLTFIQKQLILQAYNMLLPGGEMIYSTCSFSYEEDEEVIIHLLNHTDAELLPIPHFEGEWRSNLKETVHLFPHIFNGEGHFIAKIKKPGILPSAVLSNNQKNKIKTSLQLEGEFIQTKNDDIYWTNHILNLRNFYQLRNGIKIGRIDKKLGLIYDHAYSRINHNELPKIELNENEVKNYLYGLPIQKECPSGYVILTYLGIPFSLGKSSNKQIKNHYPKGLRKRF